MKLPGSLLRLPFANDAASLWRVIDEPMAPDLAPAELPTMPDVYSMYAPITAAAIGLVNPVGTGGDRGMLANLARAAFSVTGAGVKIGILSDTFNLRGGYANDQSTGALQSGFKVLQEGPAGGGDEGRAMAQLIHQIAPGAQLMFYSAFRSEADFANGIKALATAGATVIVDDVTYLDEPFFQDGGIVQAAVASVVAKGVSYFTSASNQGTNFYEHSFAAVAAPLPGLTGSYKAMNFATAGAAQTMQSLTIAKGSTATLDLQWDQPFKSIGTGHASANSLGLVLYDTSGRIVASALTNRTGGDPVQILRFSNTTAATSFRLAIITNGGSTPPGLFKYIAYGSGTTINDANAGKGSGTVIGHENMAGANSVGAIAAANTPALGGKGAIEAFSSVGPGTILFDAKGNRLAAATSGHKVDFVAPDGIVTSVFNPFYGTSAAAPDAAAVAALMLQANPALTPAQVTAMLAQSAIKVTGPAGGIGAGLIQATSAVQQAIAAKTSSITTVTAGLAPPPMAAAFLGETAQTWTLAPLAAPPPIASLVHDLSGSTDFFAQLTPGTLWPETQITTGTAFALSHNLGGQVIEILPDWSTHAFS